MKTLIYNIILIASLFGYSNALNANEAKGLNVIRFDSEIFDYIQNPSAEKEEALKSKYPHLLSAFGRTTFNKTIETDAEMFFENLRQYFSHPLLQSIYRDEQNSFRNMKQFEDDLNRANEIVNKIMPGKKLPQIAMHVSGFKENIIIVDGLISISADKYLGYDYPAYLQFFSKHERQQMQLRMLVRDILKAWIISDIIETEEKTTLLTAMIEEGKILYFLSRILPECTENDLIGYTQQQSEWCKKNEKEIWNIIINRNDLFSTDHMVIAKYIQPAPYTTTLSEQSPGKTGAWIGWQIVKAYATKNKTNIDEIIKTDARTILKSAKYNP